MRTRPSGGGGAGASRGRRFAGVVVLLLFALVAALWWGRDDAGSARPVDRTSADAPDATSDFVAAASDEMPRTRERVATTRSPTPAVGDADAGPPPGSGALTVLVRTESGVPVPGIGVIVSDRRGAWDDGVSGDDGTLRLSRSTDATTLIVALREEQSRTYLPVAPVALADDRSEAEIVLVEGAALGGRVVAPDGAPLVSVYLEAVERPSGRLLPPILTDDEGRFVALVRRGAVADVHLDGVGRMVLKPRKEGATVELREVPWRGHWTGLAPGPGERALRATRLDPFDLRVLVVTPEGEPVVGARVQTRLGRGMPTHGHVETDAEGVAHVRNLFPRPRTVVVLDTRTQRGRGWIAPAPRELTGSETEVTLALRPAATISGRIVRADGEAVTWCGIDVLHGEDSIVSCASGVDGTFEIAVPQDAPAPLRLAVRFYDEQRRCWEGAVDDVWPGAAGVEIDIALPE